MLTLFHYSKQIPKRITLSVNRVHRAFGHKISILQNAEFMDKYYDYTAVPKETELDVREFSTRLQSWAAYKMFTGVKMRKNGDWFAFYHNEAKGPFETCVAAAKEYDRLCYESEKQTSLLNFPEQNWMKGIDLPNYSFYSLNHKEIKNEANWVPPTAKKVRDYEIEARKGECLTLKETLKIIEGEGGLNIRVLNMENHSSIASYMVFVTGSTLSHEKRIGDSIVHYLRKRQIKEIPIRVTDRDESEWMVVDGVNVITNIFSPRYRMARDLEDQWELMRPGQTRYENWSNEQLQERFGNTEEKIESQSLETIVKDYQDSIESKYAVNSSPFIIDESTVNHLKEEIRSETKEEKKEEEGEEYETKDYYLTKEDFERLKNEDGTITINGQRLQIEEVENVEEDKIDESVPFIEVVKKTEKEMEKMKKKEVIKSKNKENQKH